MQILPQFTESFNRAMVNDAARQIAHKLGYATIEAFLADAPAAKMLFQQMHDQITKYAD